MKTKIVDVHREYPEFDRIRHCAKVIRQGGLVIFPTETVYGIAADFNNPRAMARLREIKHRPEDKPFSVHISQKGLISNYTSVKDPRVYKLIDEFWPGPLTVIVPTREEDRTIGIRMPQNPIALCLVRESQCTVAAPSANISGRPAPSTCQDALKELDGQVDLAIDGGPAKLGQASSVVDFTCPRPAVVRQGAVTQEEVDRVVQTKTVLFVCTGNSCRSVMAEYLLRHKLKDRRDVQVYSAGTGVFLRTSASAETISVLKAQGISAEEHQSQPLNTILLKKSDLIVVMTRSHRQQVLERCPEVEQRVYLLKEFASESDNHDWNLDIPDPIGKPASAYGECMQMIREGVDKLVNLI